VTKSPGEKQKTKNISCTGKKNKKKILTNKTRKRKPQQEIVKIRGKNSKQRATQHQQQQQQQEQKSESWWTATKYSVLSSAGAACSVAELVTYYGARRTIESRPRCVI
jgi:hypothetical protein